MNENKLSVDVITPKGELLETREYRNVPWMNYFQDEPAVIVDWLADNPFRPDEDEIKAPIQYKGRTYQGCLAWGSAVKQGQTWGLVSDVGKHLFKYVEDGVRFSRWMFAQGIWGMHQGDMKVGYVGQHESMAGNLVEDGLGYIDEDFFNKVHNGKKPIKLGKSKSSYTVWQRIPPTQELLDEIKPAFMDRLGSGTDNMDVIQVSDSSFDEKKRFFDLEPLTAYHPYLANHLSRSVPEYGVRLITTVPLETRMSLAIPTTALKITVEEGEICNRYPIDSPSSIQYVEACQDKDEIERCQHERAVQHSISSPDISIKGCLVIRQCLKAATGYDLVVCVEDVKMTNVGHPEDLNATIVFTQYYSEGSCIGVNAVWAKDVLGLDFDGDMLEHGKAGYKQWTFPNLVKAIQALPSIPTPKLTKTHRKLSDGDARPEMIVKSMSNLIGFVSNFAARTLAVKDRGMLTRFLGFSSVEAMDRRLNYFIKVGTDGFKTDVDMHAIEKAARIYVNRMDAAKHTWSPYTHWPDRQMLSEMPMIIDFINDEPKNTVVDSDGNLIEIKELSTWQKENAIWPHMDGLVPTLCRWGLPHLQAIMGEPVKVYPLSFFRKWAQQVSERDMEDTADLYWWYVARHQRVNWSDPKAVGKFKTECRREAEQFCAGRDAWTAANALWRIAHRASGDLASAASVFIMFPDECERIVTEKPGRKSNDVLKATLTGVDYQAPGLDSWKGIAVVKEIKLLKDIQGSKKTREGLVAVDEKRLVIRKCLVIDGEIKAQPPYPKGMLGLFAKDGFQPDDGQYQVSVKKVSDGAWSVHLSQ